MYNIQETIKDEISIVGEIFEKVKKELIDPIADIGNPEDIIGKPYAEWTPEDISALKQVYVYDIEPLEKFISGKEIDKLFETQKITRLMEG